jgi:hypothetical protein
MTIELIGVIAIAVGLASLFYGPPFIVYMFQWSTLLGSAAAFTLPSLGGTNIPPAHLLLAFLAIKLLGTRVLSKRVVDGLAVGSPGFWLLITLIYSVAGAYFLPRIFAGQTFVFPARTIGYTLPLEPAMSNVTQSIYLAADFVCFILLYAYAGTVDGRATLGNAALVCAALNLMFAAIDLLTYFTNTTELLSFIRNANYGLLNETELAGLKRITGSFTEASSFGAATLGYCAFTLRLWLSGIRPTLTFVLTSLSLIALLYSTSTTAYVGLAAFLAVVYLGALANALRRQINSQTLFFIAGVPIVLPALIIAIALIDNSSYVKDLFDTLVLNKMSSDSGIERSSWNSQGLQNLFDTFGFGVGNGSMRASSYAISVLASLGIFGALPMAIFLILVFVSRARRNGSHRETDAYQKAAKYACLAWLMTSLASGALVDLGLPFFIFAAVACSRSSMPTARPTAFQEGKALMHT